MIVQRSSTRDQLSKNLLEVYFNLFILFTGVVITGLSFLLFVRKGREVYMAHNKAGSAHHELSADIILAVDDSPVALRQLVSILERDNYLVLAAALPHPACLFQPLCSLALCHIALLCN